MVRAATSWPFVAAVSLLLLNDHYLKAAYSNWITGKVSDFAGIFFVSLLLFTAYPRAAYRTAALIGAVFALWKSPWSQPVLDLVPNMGRTVDYSDLIALVTMPLSYRVATDIDRYRLGRPAIAKALCVPILAVTCVAVLGTSFVPYTETYSMRRSERQEPFDPAAAAKIIAEVASSNKLRCIMWCDQLHERGVYEGLGIEMHYRVSGGRSIDVSLESRNSGRTWQLMEVAQGLRFELGTRLNISVVDSKAGYEQR